MNAKTLEAITRHGQTLLRAFPNAAEKNPVALCKKLRRIETAIHYDATQYCNGDMIDADFERAENSAMLRARKLLGLHPGNLKDFGSILFINRDPRGCALKLEDAWTWKWNAKQYAAGLPALHTDMGGYGIIAPDLNQ